MDETREVGSQTIASDATREIVRDAVGELAAALLTGDRGFESVACRALDGILALSQFERGIFLVLVGADVNSANVVSSRTAGRSSVLHPELAVERAVLERLITTGQPVVLNDCLSSTAEAHRHRSVVCHTFALRPGAEGIIYLDRPMGKGGITRQELDLLEDCSDRVLPWVSLAYVNDRLEMLESRASAAAMEGVGEGGDAGGETGGERGFELSPEAAANVFEYHGMVSCDDAMNKIFAVVEKVKDADLNICVVGESGTGKELLARAVHQASHRHDKLFVAENCGSIAENLLESELFGHVKGAFTGADEDRKGLFELANGGTLFLDEIGDMSEGMQRKLLRVLEEGEVRPIGAKQPIKADVRVICASNRDLKELVRQKTFRADLYYRLNVVSVVLPPLRERSGDVDLLTARFLAEISEEEGVRKRLSESALRAFREYTWPGNLRELRNVVRRVLLTCPNRIIARKDVSGLLRAAGTSPYSGDDLERDENQLVLRLPAKQSFNAIISECERIVLQNALKECGWNKSKVTKVLKIPRQSLYNKIAKYNLTED